jgi:predicted esterase
MKRLPSSLFFALSLATLAVGCGEDEKKPSGGSGSSCDEDEIGEPCDCPDDSEGVYECSKSDKLVCACEEEDEDVGPATGSDEDDEDDEDETPAAPVDSGANKPDAGAKPDTGTGTGTAGKDSGPPSSGGGGGSGDGGGPVTMNPPVGGGGGEEPTIPAMMGECPEFKNGTVTVAGHRGVVLQAGEPNKKGALLFYWHGTGQSASEVNRQVPAAARDEILKGGGIIASFNGSQSAKGAGDCSGTGAHNISDFLAADQIVACAVAKHGIDPRRIYTTGCSAGGLQSGCMAQARSSYIAAAAPNSGGIVFPQKWQSKNAPAIFTMHGGASDMVIVTFSKTSADLDKSAKAQGSFVVNCNHNGIHCGAPGPLQSAAWKFMNEHPFGTKPSPWAGGIPAGVPDYCKIY